MLATLCGRISLIAPDYVCAHSSCGPISVATGRAQSRGGPHTQVGRCALLPRTLHAPWSNISEKIGRNDCKLPRMAEYKRIASRDFPQTTSAQDVSLASMFCEERPGR